MFKNALSRISSSVTSAYQQIKEKISPGTVQKETSHAVQQVLNPSQHAANDENFHPETHQTVVHSALSAKNIIDLDDQCPLKVLGNFTGPKILTLGSDRKQKYKLYFIDGIIKKALKEINGKYIPVNAQTIRKLSLILRKTSNELSQVSYSTKKNSPNKTQKENLQDISDKMVKENVKIPTLKGSNKHKQFQQFQYKQDLKHEAEKQKNEAKQKIEFEKHREMGRIERENNWYCSYKNIQKYTSIMEKKSISKEEELKISKLIFIELQKYIPKQTDKKQNVVSLHPAARNFDNIKILIATIANFLSLEGNESQIGGQNQALLINLFSKASRSMYKHYWDLARDEQTVIENRKFEGVLINHATGNIEEDIDKDTAEKYFWDTYKSKNRA